MMTTTPSNPNTRKAYKYRADAIARYLVEHGSPPPCECGCGEPVNFDQNGRPNRFVNHHFKADPTIATSVRLGDTIPIERIRAATRQIKEARGWTWDDVAERAGMSKGHVTSMMFGKTQRTVTRKWAKGYFTRLAGGATIPTPHQRRRLAKRRQALQETAV